MASLATFQNSSLFMPTLVGLSGIAGAYLYKEFIAEDELEKEELEEIIGGEIKEKTELFGSSLSKKVNYGLQELGKANKVLQVKVGGKPGKEEEEDIEIEEYAFIQTKPTGLFNWLGWAIVDNLFGFSKFTNNLVVERKYINDQDVLRIDNDWQPSKLGGIWINSNKKGVDFAQSITFKKMLEDTLNAAKEQVKDIIWLNHQYAQKVQFEKTSSFSAIDRAEEELGPSEK